MHLHIYIYIYILCILHVPTSRPSASSPSPPSSPLPPWSSPPLSTPAARRWCPTCSSYGFLAWKWSGNVGFSTSILVFRGGEWFYGNIHVYMFFYGNIHVYIYIIIYIYMYIYIYIWHLWMFKNQKISMERYHELIWCLWKFTDV